MAASRLLVLPVLLLLAVAGCLDEGAKDLGDGPVRDLPVVVDEADVGLYFGPDVKVADRANGEAENFVSVSPDGQTILECMHGEFAFTPMMLASQDGGASFRELELGEPSPGGDCETTFGEAGRWFFVHSTVVGATVVSTADQGETWIVSRVTALPTNGLADRPWIATAGKSVFLSYIPVWHEPGTLGFVKSDDEGRTWSTPRTLTTMEPGKTNLYAPKMLVSPDNETVRIPFLTYPPVLATAEVAASTGGWFRMAVSPDKGETWSIQDVRGPDPDFIRAHTTATLAGQDTIYWAYVVQNGTTWEARVIVSFDDGATWSEPRFVFGGFSLLGLPWIDGRPDGSATLVLEGIGSGASPDSGELGVTVVRLDAHADRLVQWVLPFGEGGGEFSTVDHDAAGRAFVGYLRGDALWMRREVVPAASAS